MDENIDPQNAQLTAATTGSRPASRPGRSRALIHPMSYGLCLTGALHRAHGSRIVICPDGFSPMDRGTEENEPGAGSRPGSASER